MCLDYGLKQGEEEDENFLPAVDAVAISHGHLDHIGNLPYAIKKNENTKVFGTETTKRITDYQLKDILKIAERNLKFNGNGGKKRSFSLDDVLTTMKNWEPLNYGEPVEHNGFKISLYNAGHIPGSSMIEVEHGGKRVVYTGDINYEGNFNGEMPDISRIRKDPDVLIIESTYGDEIRMPIKMREAKLVAEVKDAIKRGRNVLIPAFAIERMQKVAKLLDSVAGEFPEYKFYAVSPSYLAMKDIAYRELRLASVEESAGLPPGYRNKKTVVLTTSGFCTGGISKKAFQDVAGDKDYSVIIPSGFIPKNSPLRQAIDEGTVYAPHRKTKTKKVKAEIKQVSLSAHSDVLGLTSIIDEICPSKTSRIILVHGEPKALNSLKTRLVMDGYSVYIPKKGEEKDLC